MTRKKPTSPDKTNPNVSMPVTPVVNKKLPTEKRNVPPSAGTRAVNTSPGLTAAKLDALVGPMNVLPNVSLKKLKLTELTPSEAGTPKTTVGALLTAWKPEKKGTVLGVNDRSTT